MNFNKKYHSFHIVDPSPWPFLISIGALVTTIGAVKYMQRHETGFEIFQLGIIISIACLLGWVRSIIIESTYQKHHTNSVLKSHQIGFALFIISEIMFFFGFFWAFFHSSLAPAIEIGCVWPPVGISPIDPLGVPLFNTALLLFSGVTITLVHHSVRGQDNDSAVMGFIYTIICAIAFIFVQYKEYIHSTFDISDSVYGSTFFMTTGFHGFHVIIGLFLILTAFFRTQEGHFTPAHHFGLEAAIWYWHFVDVVWIFLYCSIYLWGYGDVSNFLKIYI